MKNKNSLIALTLGLHAEKLSMLTDSNLKYTMYLKRRKKEGKGQADDESEGITRENYWMYLANEEDSSSESLVFLFYTSRISRTFAMYNQTIMISSLDRFSQLRLAQKRELSKFFRNLCENNCVYFKDFFFHAPITREESESEKKYASYLVDILIEFILFFNKDKRFLGYWEGALDQPIHKKRLFERNQVLINFFKHILYLLTEIMDGLITSHSVESELIFDEFLEQLVSNETYMGLVEIINFLFRVDFTQKKREQEFSNKLQMDGRLPPSETSVGLNKISDVHLE